MTTPLEHYLPIQKATEKIIRDQLLDAADEADKIVKRLSASAAPTKSANVRIAQYRTASRGVQAVLADLWTDGIGPAVTSGTLDAAAEAASMDVLTDVLTETSGINRDTWESSMRQTAKQNVNNYRSRVEKSYIPLSQRVYRNTALSKGQVDRVINNGLILGKSAKEVAQDVKKYISPNVPGGVSYAAMRLARTELNNAFHATTIIQHGNMPWVTGMEWHLSGSHPKTDICNSLVKTYKVDDTPGKPHPQCLCYITPVTKSEDKFIRDFKRGDYDAEIDALLNGA